MNQEKQDDSHPPNGGDKPDNIEQVLATNVGSSDEEQIAQLRVALKKREELAALRKQMQIMPMEGMKGLQLKVRADIKLLQQLAWSLFKE